LLDDADLYEPCKKPFAIGYIMCEAGISPTGEKIASAHKASALEMHFGSPQRLPR